MLITIIMLITIELRVLNINTERANILPNIEK